jgi:hypothetical protein
MYIAQIAAEEYHTGKRHMSPEQKKSIDEFYPAARNYEVCVEPISTLAQYMVSLKRR